MANKELSICVLDVSSSMGENYHLPSSLQNTLLSLEFSRPLLNTTSFSSSTLPSAESLSSSSSFSKLDYALKGLQLYCRSKEYANKGNEMGIILYGSENTQNRYAKEDEQLETQRMLDGQSQKNKGKQEDDEEPSNQFDNIEVIHYPSLINAKEMQAKISRIGIEGYAYNENTRSTKNTGIPIKTNKKKIKADFVSAFVVAMDMVQSMKRKFKRVEILFFTDGKSNFDKNLEKEDINNFIEKCQLYKIDLNMVSFCDENIYTKSLQEICDHIKSKNQSYLTHRKTDGTLDGWEQGKDDSDGEILYEYDDDEERGNARKEIQEMKALRDSNNQMNDKSLEKEYRRQIVTKLNMKFFLSLIEYRLNCQIYPVYIFNHMVSRNQKVVNVSKKKLTLEMADTFKVPVTYYLYVSRAKAPSLVKFNENAFLDGSMDSTESTQKDNIKEFLLEKLENNLEKDRGAVETSKLYKVDGEGGGENVQINIPLHDREKSFKYGNDYVPVPSHHLQNMKLKADPGPNIKICFFVDSSIIKPYMFTDATYCILPEETSPAAIEMMYAFQQSMIRSDKVALVRFRKTGASNPALGILMPSRFRSRHGEKSFVKKASGTNAISRKIYTRSGIEMELQPSTITVKSDMMEGNPKYSKKRKNPLNDDDERYISENECTSMTDDDEYDALSSIDRHRAASSCIPMFFLNQLPFAEDIRDFPLPSLLNPVNKEGYVPSEEQLKCTQRLIDSMMLSAPSTPLVALESEDTASKKSDQQSKEYSFKNNLIATSSSLKVTRKKKMVDSNKARLLNRLCYNPFIQRTMDTMWARSVSPSCPLPDHQPSQIAPLFPPSASLASMSTVKELQEFESMFPLRRVASKAKQAHKRSKYWHDLPVISGSKQRKDSIATDDGKENQGGRKQNDMEEEIQEEEKKKENLGKTKVDLMEKETKAPTRISTIDPITDFNLMLQSEDQDIRNDALQKICAVIESLVSSKLKPQCRKAISCMIALRKACIIEVNGEFYNKKLKLWREKYFERQNENDENNLMFWKMLQVQYNEESVESNSKIGMITTEEDTGVEEYRLESAVRAFMLAPKSDFPTSIEGGAESDIQGAFDKIRGGRGQSRQAPSTQEKIEEEEDMDDLV